MFLAFWRKKIPVQRYISALRREYRSTQSSYDMMNATPIVLLPLISAGWQVLSVTVKHLMKIRTTTTVVYVELHVEFWLDKQASSMIVIEDAPTSVVASFFQTKPLSQGLTSSNSKALITPFNVQDIAVQVDLLLDLISLPL